jgi:hypothetical protein
MALWTPVTNHIPDDEDRDGPRNVGFLYTSDAADCPRRLYCKLNVLNCDYVAVIISQTLFRQVLIIF